MRSRIPRASARVPSEQAGAPAETSTRAVESAGSAIGIPRPPDDGVTLAPLSPDHLGRPLAIRCDGGLQTHRLAVGDRNLGGPSLERPRCFATERGCILPRSSPRGVSLSLRPPQRAPRGPCSPLRGDGFPVLHTLQCSLHRMRLESPAVKRSNEDPNRARHPPLLESAGCRLGARRGWRIAPCEKL